MKTYSGASHDLWEAIDRMQKAYHPDLAKVSVGALFVFDDEGGDQVLKHNGYWAAAVVSITPIKQRALGIADAIIVIDRSCWTSMSQARRDALIDHELTHLEHVHRDATATEPAGPMYDAVNRPKLAMRRHDHQLGWFDEVATRHGEHSTEVIQARQLVSTTQQLYFNFAARFSATLKSSPASGPDEGWPRWSEDNGRYENRDGTPYEGSLVGMDPGDTSMTVEFSGPDK